MCRVDAGRLLVVLSGDDPFHRRCTESTFVILLRILTASLLLIPDQGRVAVGLEILLIGPSWRAARCVPWPIVRVSLTPPTISVLAPIPATATGFIVSPFRKRSSGRVLALALRG